LLARRQCQSPMFRGWGFQVTGRERPLTDCRWPFIVDVRFAPAQPDGTRVPVPATGADRITIE